MEDKNTNITTTIRQQKRVKSDVIINDLIDINWGSFPFQITDVQNSISNSLTWSINMPSGRYLRLKHLDNLSNISKASVRKLITVKNHFKSRNKFWSKIKKNTTYFNIR